MNKVIKPLTDLVNMDGGEAIDWIIENQYDYVLVKQSHTQKKSAPESSKDKDELEGIKIGLQAVAQDIERQERLSVTFKDNDDAREFHIAKARYLKSALKTIETNKNFYLANKV